MCVFLFTCLPNITTYRPITTILYCGSIMTSHTHTHVNTYANTYMYAHTNTYTYTRRNTQEIERMEEFLLKRRYLGEVASEPAHFP